MKKILLEDSLLNFEIIDFIIYADVENLHACNFYQFMPLYFTSTIDEGLIWLSLMVPNYRFPNQKRKAITTCKDKFCSQKWRW